MLLLHKALYSEPDKNYGGATKNTASEDLGGGGGVCLLIFIMLSQNC